MKFLFSLLMAGFAAPLFGAAYYQEVTTKPNTSASLPFAYTTLICETKAEYDQAKANSPGWYWKEQTTDEFCQMAHAHVSNGCNYRRVKSWKGFITETSNCYARDRLVAGCRLSRWMNDKHFRCVNFIADFQAEKQRIAAEKLKLYQAWQEEVRKKKQIAMDNAEPVRRELERQAQAGEKAIADKKTEIAKQEKDAATAKTMVDDFLKFHAMVVGELEQAVKDFNAANDEMQRAMTADRAGADAMNAWLRETVTLATSAGATADALRAQRARIDDWRKNVCAGNRAAEVLEKLRNQQARARDLVSWYAFQLQNLPLPAGFASAKDVFTQNVSLFTSQIAQRDTPYDADAKVLESLPATCPLLDGVESLLEARLQLAVSADAGSALGALTSDLAAKLQALQLRATKDRQLTAARRYLAAMAARLADDLANGHSTEGRHEADAAGPAAKLMLQNLKEGGQASATELDELQKLADGTIGKMAQDRDQYLKGVANLRARASQRLQNLMLAAQAAEEAAQARPADLGRWRSVVAPAIEHSLHLKLAALPAVPAFTDETAALKFDACLAAAEDRVATFTASLRGGL